MEMVRIAAAAALAFSTLAGDARATAATPLPSLHLGAPRTGPSGCAWPFIVDSENLNLAYPDPNSTYWATPFALGPGESLTLLGTYPSARFMAITLYDATGDTVAQLSDFQIEPEPGSANPYAEADPPAGSGRSWRLRVVPAGSPEAGPNVLYVPSGQRAGWLVARVYLGNPPGDPQGGVPLPSIERDRPGRPVVDLAPCRRFLPGVAIAQILAQAMPDPVFVTAPPELVRLADDGGLFANEANAYLSAFADAAPGRILVVRGALPTAPDTGAGQSVVGDFDLRYFSITSNLNQKPYPVVDGVYDAELPLDAAGHYTVVVAQDGDVPANATAANGVAALEWGDGPSSAVIVRNMLPASGFAHAVQDVTPSTYGAPSDASDVMAAFYPVVVECTTALFEAAGAAGCFAAAGVPLPGAQ
jgi:hypothetical protein